MTSSVKGVYSVLGRSPIHPFPARMAPSIALRALSQLKKNSVVLDPMAGSGTVLAMGKANGHRCIGFDVDPLAVLLSKVWTRSFDSRAVEHEAVQVFEKAKQRFASLAVSESYPANADEETRAFIRYWYDGYARRQLAALSREIEFVSNASIRDFLWCAFSRMIITKSSGVSLAMDLSHSRPHRSFSSAPQKPFNIFLMTVNRVLAGCLHTNTANRGPITRVEIGDARKMVAIEDGAIDLVFTSPPYLNAIDYMRCSKFSLVWMGYSIAEIRKIRNESIGSESSLAPSKNSLDVLDRLELSQKLSSRTEGILRRYINDTAQVMKEVSRVLAKHGRAVYVVGENTIQGTYIPTGHLHTILAEQAGLKLSYKRYRDLPANRRYLPPPRATGASLDARMRREVILSYRPA